MDRKRANTAPLLLENRSMHGASQNDPFYTQFPSLEPKICKLLPVELPFSLSPEYKFPTSLLDLWPDSPSFGTGSQSEVQNDNRCGAEFVNNEQELNNETAEAPSHCSPSTSQTRRRENFTDYNARDDVSIVYLSDSPNSQHSYSSEEDSDVVIYEGTTRREPRMDGSVVCLDNDDKEIDESPHDGDQIARKRIVPDGDQIARKRIAPDGDQIARKRIVPDSDQIARKRIAPDGNQIARKRIVPLRNTEDPEPSTSATDLSTHSQLAGNDENVTSDSSEGQRTSSELQVPRLEQQLSQEFEKKIESERAMVETLRAELNMQKQNYEWQEAKVRYLEIKLQERNDFEYKLEAVNQLNDMLEKKLFDLEKSASNLPIFEKELKRLREKTKLLEEDKRCKEELGQTISNLIDDKTNLKTENESLTSIASMLEKENSTLKQKCETLEKAAEKATICTGDNLFAENCCIRTKELRDRMTESLENEFKCSICEEIFVEATVTNCNHVFCAHCLSEWMKKKKDCPYCRKHVSQQCRAPVIDEFVLTVCKLLSEKMHSDRLQVVQERKILSSKKVPQQGSARKLANGAVRVVPIANLRNMPPTNRSSPHFASYMRAAMNAAVSSAGSNYYSSMMDESVNNFDFYLNTLYPGGAASTATASATSSMAATSASTAPAPPVQMLPLDARMPRPQGSSAQSTATASSSVHVSSTSSSAAPMPSSATASMSSSTAVSSTAPDPPAYPFSWSRSLSGNDNLPGYGTNGTLSTLYNSSRPTVAAVNPFSALDETSPSQRTLCTSHRSPLSNRLTYPMS